MTTAPSRRAASITESESVIAGFAAAALAGEAAGDAPGDAAGAEAGLAAGDAAVDGFVAAVAAGVGVLASGGEHAEMTELSSNNAPGNLARLR